MSVLRKQKRAHIESLPTLISINFSKHFRYSVNDVPIKVFEYQVFLKTDTTQEYIDHEVHLCFGVYIHGGQNLKVKMYVHRHMHNVYYTWAVHAKKFSLMFCSGSDPF